MLFIQHPHAASTPLQYRCGEVRSVLAIGQACRIQAMDTVDLVHRHHHRAALRGEDQHARHHAPGTLLGRQHLDAIDDRRTEGVLAHLPQEDGHRSAGLWLAWAELARAEPTLWSTVGKWHLNERAAFAIHFVPPTGERRRPRPDPKAVETVYAILIGLRMATTRHLEPVPVDRARDLLTAAYDRHRPLPRWF